MDPTQLAILAASYQAAVSNHNESLARVAAARAALEAADKELADATVQVGDTLTASANAQAALLGAALNGVIPA